MSVSSVSKAALRRTRLFLRMGRTIREFGMLQRGDRVLVGLSGGPDSCALTHALALLGERLSLELHALYVDHGIRQEAVAQDLAAASDLARALGVAFHTRRVDAPGYAKARRLSLETAARELRYEALEQLAREVGAGKVALGHTADDQAETVLMWVLRGTGLAGLSGIPPVRGPFIRPLLDVWRRDVLAYCRLAGIAFSEDATNRSPAHLRNRIRLQLLPFIESQIRPGARSALVRLARLARDDEGFIDQAVQAAWESVVCAGPQGRLSLSANELIRLPAPVARRIVLRAFEKVSGGHRGSVGMEHVEALMELARHRRGGARAELPCGVTAQIAQGRLHLTLRPEDGLRA